MNHSQAEKTGDSGHPGGRGERAEEVGMGIDIQKKDRGDEGI